MRHQYSTSPDAGAAMLSLRSRRMIATLNNDEIIGPCAPGDGDLIEWWFRYFLILIYEFSRAHPDLPANDLASLDTRPTPKRAAGEHFADYCKKMALGFVADVFNGLTEPQAATWSKYYGLLESDLAKQWGGRKVRFSVRPKNGHAAGRIAEGLRLGMPIDDAFRYAGVSRATGYRILKRKQ